MKLLLIDDDPSITSSIYFLLHKTYVVDCVSDAKSALQKLKQHKYNLILLDLKLPDIQGDRLLQIIRETGVQAPVLVISGLSDANVKANLLDLGANDYITKPFQNVELCARIRAVIRNRYKKLNSNVIKSGYLSLDTATRQVFYKDTPIQLRRKEFDLLECLVLNANNVVAHEVLAAYVWDEDQNTMPNTLQVHINQLRRKIDKPFKTALIRTVHGVGYALHDPLAPRGV